MTTPTSTPTHGQTLHGKSLLFARLGWVAITLVTVGLDLYAIPALYQQVAIPCADTGPCGEVQFRASQAALLHNSAFSMETVAALTVGIQTAAMLLFVGVAAVLFWRRSDDRIALFCAYMLVTFGGAGFNGAMQALPAVGRGWFAPVMTLDIIGQVTFVAFFFVFPDGRFTPGWTRWVALLWACAWITAYFPGTAPRALADVLISGPLFVALLFILVFAQVYRYRRVSNARQRQQTKWVVYGFAVGLGAFAAMLAVVNVAFGNLAGESVVVNVALSAVVYVSISLIPITIGVAILRSQLYDIDVLINRTLVYGSLTIVLAAVYFGCVLGAQAIVQALTGQRSLPTLIIVASTLLIAALFNPLRRRIQATIDRRFYRSKYDAAKTLQAFGATLRTGTDVEHLYRHVLAVVEQTMQPAHMSLWLRQSKHSHGSPANEDR